MPSIWLSFNWNFPNNSPIWKLSGAFFDVIFVDVVVLVVALQTSIRKLLRWISKLGNNFTRERHREGTKNFSNDWIEIDCFPLVRASVIYIVNLTTKMANFLSTALVLFSRCSRFTSTQNLFIIHQKCLSVVLFKLLK